jgi:hypothetical protein
VGIFQKFLLPRIYIIVKEIKDELGLLKACAVIDVTISKAKKIKANADSVAQKPIKKFPVL